MRADELDHVRADVRAAMTDAQFADRSLLPDLLDHLLTAVGKLALDPYAEFKPYIYEPPRDPRSAQPRRPHPSPASAWAAALLRECQIRAVSQIPFAEQPGDDQPHWSDHL